MDADFRHLINLTTTSLKLKILEKLKNPAGISALAKSLSVSRDTVKPHIRNFLEARLVERCGDGYRLTIFGRIVLEKAFEIEKVMSISEDVKEFLATHDTSSIPEELIGEMHLLHRGHIIQSSDPFELSGELIDILRGSDWIKGVSPVYHPEFPALFTDLMEERDVELILTGDVFEKCMARHPELILKFAERGKIRVCDSAKVAFVVAEKGFVMGLYIGDVYDANRIYICKSDDAVRWGLKLFNYFYTMSRKALKD